MTVIQNKRVADCCSEDNANHNYEIDALFNNPLAGLCFVDTQGVFLKANECFCQMLGFERGQLLGVSVADIFPEHNNAFRQGVFQALQGQSNAMQNIQFNDHNFIANFSSVKNPSGENSGAAIVFIDITQFHQAMSKLSLAEERTNYALDSAGQWIWDLDIRTNRVWRSPQYAKILGLNAAETRGGGILWDIVFAEDKAKADHALNELISGKRDVFEAVYRVRRQNGELIWILSRGKVVEWALDGTPVRVLATSVNIDGQKYIENQLSSIIDQKNELERHLMEVNRKLRAQSEYDHLTNLPNRHKFSNHLKIEFAKALETKKPLSVLMIDVDYFKAFNDFYGHMAGDKCLAEIGRSLRQVFSLTEQVVARFGGEEFVAILVDTPQDEALVIAQKIVDTIAGLNIPHVSSVFSVVTVSIGICTLDGNNSDTIADAYNLLNLADKALYKTKGTGRNGVHVWDTYLQAL